MFQSFEETGSSAESANRLGQLKAILSQAGVDGFIVPRADEHQGEYIPASAERLRWLTGFTGSAGFAVVLPDEAAVFSDGRYTVQLAAQVDDSAFQPVNSVETTLADYLCAKAKGLKIGFDPWLHTLGEVRALRKAGETAGFTLVPMSRNAIDLVWQDRPAPPKEGVRLHEDRFAGRDAEDKRREMAAALETAGADLAVLTDPASVAWALNIRGADVPHKPLPLSFAILKQEGLPLLFIAPEKLDTQTSQVLSARAEIYAPEAFESELRKASTQATVLLDPALTARRIADIVESGGGRIVEAPDPVALPRARKNEGEIAGTRAAHLRDGAAMVSFLAWLDGQAPGTLTEIDAARKLEDIRIAFGERDGMALQDISFDTISGAGPNAALPHYRVNETSNRVLGEGEVYLVDSGGQYLDGTTDITRTVAIGTVPDEVKRKFTLVLKGMIAISTARFPKGTRGLDLDPLARIALWKTGCDYAHGTGHGVGSYLGVHEGPQSISRRGATVLEAGMIVSNEPGYYREGAFGIRIENLLLTLAPESLEGGDLPMHAFETLTFAPIDRRLIVSELLEKTELEWLDLYHAEVRERLSTRIEKTDRLWLEQATLPLSR